MSVFILTRFTLSKNIVNSTAVDTFKFLVRNVNFNIYIRALNKSSLLPLYCLFALFYVILHYFMNARANKAFYININKTQ